MFDLIRTRSAPTPRVLATRAAERQHRSSARNVLFTLRNPELIQAGTLMTMIIPVVAFLLLSRSFTRGIVITRVET